MKYYIFKNVYIFKKEFFKSLFIQLFALVLFLFIDYKLLSTIRTNDFKLYLGLMPFQDCSSFEIIIKLIFIFNVINITYKIYLSYISYGSSNILLRMNSKNIFLYSFISCFMFTLMLRITYFIIFFLFLNKYLNFNFELLYILFYDLIYYFLFSILSILFINKICSKYAVFIILPIVIFITCLFYNLNILVMIIVIILLSFINYLIFKPSYIYNFYFKK